MFKAKNNFGRVESNFTFREDAMLRQMIVQIATIHQVKNETQFFGRLKCICHADDKRAAILQLNI